MSPNNRARLRELGYSVDADGKIICHRRHETKSAVLPTRYQHERCGVLRIDLDRDSKAGRELVERLILVVDEPRALIGRTRNGSAVMLFRATEETVLPAINGQIYDERGRVLFELVAADGLRFQIECTTHAVLDPSEYTWAKGRSPLDVPHDSLAVLFADIGEAVIDAAFKTGAQWASIYDADEARARKLEKSRPAYEARLAAGYYSADAIQAREDEALVASNPEGNYWSDGAMGTLIEQARRRIAMRKQQQKESAQA